MAKKWYINLTNKPIILQMDFFNVLEIPKGRVLVEEKIAKKLGTNYLKETVPPKSAVSKIVKNRKKELGYYKTLKREELIEVLKHDFKFSVIDNMLKKEYLKKNDLINIIKDLLLKIDEKEEEYNDKI